MKTLFLLIILFMIVATQVGRVSAQQSQYPTILIVNPLSPTNSSTFDFNSSAYPINSTFTAAVYITSVTNLSSWQVELSWDNSIINFATAWIPTNNVFEPAINNGATLIETSPETDLGPGLMLIGCTNLYTSTYPPLYPVNVQGEALLFYVNFTIAATPNATQTLSTELGIIKQLPNSPPGYLSSFVTIYPSETPIEVATQSGMVSISGSQAVVHTIVDVSVVGMSFSESPIYLGDNLTITTTFANNGTDLETFNFNLSETFKSTPVELLAASMSVLPNTTGYYLYTWNIPGNLAAGNYTIEAQMQPPPGQNNTQYTTFATVIHIGARSTWLEYSGYLILVMLQSRLGIMFMAYVVAVICFFAVLFARERMKMRSVKIR
jgi:hypothetical protein